jgi:acetolactate synthase-1/3 small subunit
MDRIHTLSIFTENSPGVLHRITAVFTRRKINIESLTVSETVEKGISRFTISVKCPDDLVDKVAKQINRVIEVVDIFVAKDQDLVFREIALFKLAVSSAEQREKVESELSRHDAKISYASEESIIVEKAGTEDEIASLHVFLQPYNIIQFVRSGRVALLKATRQDKSNVIESKRNVSYPVSI